MGYLPARGIPGGVTTRTTALDTLVFGVDIQSGDVRGDAPSYALVTFDGEAIERDVVSRRKLLRLIADHEPDLIATDNMYELAEDKDALVYFLRSLPPTSSLVQVTGDERPEPLSRVANRHGVPYGKDPMQEAEAAARLAARNVGFEVSAFTNTTTVKVSRGRSTGKGGWSEDRYTRRIHGSVRKRTREIGDTLDDAGLDYDLTVTEKYGGYANARFTVQATPAEIPVSAGRAGDVRVEIERQRRDGIEFEPLAKRRDHVIVGVDPGTTTAIALVDLQGTPLDVMSTRTDDTAAVIEWIIERGRPVLVAADVAPMPGTVEKLRRSFDAGSWTPGSDLPIDEKQHRTREHGYDNDHERDALAAALFAHDAHDDQFDRIRRRVSPRHDPNAVIARVVAGESLEAVIDELEADEAPSQVEAGSDDSRSREATRKIASLEQRLDRLEDYVERLESTIEEKDEEIAEYEEALEDARREDRRDVRERRTVNRLEREVDRLERALADERDRADGLEAKLERLKALWKLDHSDFDAVSEKVDQALVPVKPIDQFTLDAIEAADEDYGLAPGEVILLRDASGAGRRTAERLATVEPRVILKRGGGLSEVADEVLFEHAIPVGPADDVTIREVDELAVAREADVEAVIDDWRDRARQRERSRNAQLVDRVISEHRAERRDTTPAEFLDS